MRLRLFPSASLHGPVRGTSIAIASVLSELLPELVTPDQQRRDGGLCHVFLHWRMGPKFHADASDLRVNATLAVRPAQHRWGLLVVRTRGGCVGGATRCSASLVLRVQRRLVQRGPLVGQLRGP